jgi:Uma2 family endonuclease
MVQQFVPPSIEYPESDGLPLADNTTQFRLITTIHGGLDALLPDTFVAADLLWYPIEGDPSTSAAPDVMVAFGRPKGDRRSYLQWNEDNIAPQVVFEIASPSNTLKELEEDKLRFYQENGVEEYYLYYPDRQTFKGWLRDEESLDEESLQPIASTDGWVSPRLKVRFELVEGELQLYRPDGRRFATYAEIEARASQAEERASLEKIRAERAEAQIEQSQAIASQAEERAQLAEAQATLLAQRLRELGVNPDELL